MTETSASPRSRYVNSRGLDVHVTEWGAADAPAIIMWHGLARSGRDFDTIARAFRGDNRIICPDTIGRGFSQWSSNPDADYCFARYVEIASDIIADMGVDTMTWIGTSMGGVLGMRMAAGPMKGRIGKLVINDIGPTLPEAPKERIKGYVGNPPQFATIRELESYMREIYAPFGPHTDTQWRHMAETLSRRLPSGQITTHYDPAIVRQFFVHENDYELWDVWDQIECPTLVLHGLESDLLLPEIADEMTRRGPETKVVGIPGCGHAPGLVLPEHIEIIRDFVR